MGGDASCIETRRGRGDAGGLLAVTPRSIRLGQGLLKSQRWKIRRAQAVSLVWLPQLDESAGDLPVGQSLQEGDISTWKWGDHRKAFVLIWVWEC